MRKVISAAVGAVLALGVVGSVAAATPDREPIVNITSVDNESCTFPVEWSFPVQNEFQTTFYDANGNPTKVIITGRIVFTFTNLNTGKSVTGNASGPGVFNFKTGRLFALGAGGGPIEGEGIVFGHGQLDVLTLEFRGHLVSVCDALAP